MFVRKSGPCDPEVDQNLKLVNKMAFPSAEVCQTLKVVNKNILFLKSVKSANLTKNILSENRGKGANTITFPFLKNEEQRRSHDQKSVFLKIAEEKQTWQKNVSNPFHSIPFPKIFST